MTKTVEININPTSAELCEVATAVPGCRFNQHGKCALFNEFLRQSGPFLWARLDACRDAEVDAPRLGGLSRAD